MFTYIYKYNTVYAIRNTIQYKKNTSFKDERRVKKIKIL